MQKKILIIGPAFPLRGGIADFNEALCREYVHQHISCSIISFYFQYPGFLFPGSSQTSSGKAPVDLTIKPLISSINPLSWYQTVNKIREVNPDYLLIRYWLPFMAPSLGTIAKYAKKNSSIKVIAITDNVIPHEKRMGDRLLTSFFIKQCDAFVAMSQSVLNDLKTFTDNTHTALLPHPVYELFGEKIDKEKARENLGLQKGERYILFFGFIRHYKGLDLLLEAMADARVKNLNVKLVVAGEYYEDRERYENIIHQHGLNNSIIMRTEFIPAEMVKNYFCATDLIVQPYKHATQSGITQIAYQFERPMLVTNVGGLPEIVPDQHVGYVVSIAPDAIAHAIVDFYINNREEVFSRNAANEKKKYTWNSFVAGVERLFDKL